MDLGIAGRRALVAASSAGLGKSAAAALVEAGCEVAISGRDAERAAATASEVGAAAGLAGDVSTPEGATALVDEARSSLGGIDILVTNAGGPPPGTFETTPMSDYQLALDLNLMSVVAMCSAAVPPMREAGWGRVVAITSISVRQPIENLILSNTARAGATGFLKTLALEVAGDGVTVNSVQPGFHLTGRLADIYGEDGVADLAATVPTGTIGDPDDFGRICAFLCSESAKFVTGAAIPVAGGADRGLQ